MLEVTFIEFLFNMFVYHYQGTPCDLVTGEDRRYAVSVDEPAKHVSCTVEMTSIQQECKDKKLISSVLYSICRVFRANYNCAIDINKSYVI